MPDLPAPRPLAAADLDDVARIEAAIFPDPWSKRAFTECLARGEVRGWAQDDGTGRLIGYGLCARAADEGEVLNLAVDARSRRHGAGRALLRTMLAWLLEEGAGRVYLEVRRSNDAAISLYERAGFRPLGTRRAYYAHPREDAVTMVLEVGPGPAVK